MKEQGRKFLCLIVLVLSMQSYGQVRDKWNGKVSYTQKTTGSFIKINEMKIDVVIANSLVQDELVYKADHSFTTSAGTVISKKNCDGQGTGELHAVDISGDEYYVHIVTHTYNCASVTTEEGTRNFTEQSDITFTGRFFNNNHDVLSGSDTTKVDNGAGEVQTIITWFLVRGPLDVELIVTPIKYNTWEPEATGDELRKGNAMEIDLKIQKRNGQPTPLRVESFELRLSGTSQEKGTTINMPLNPSANQLPDLRFIPVAIAESNNADQSITVTSPDGRTGKAYIASYDGGGWTTLNVVATLYGGLRIQGSLLAPGGIKQIPIPKRNPASHIATSWLVANRNPAETDDKELFTTIPGDGLTAYEEYRGVISQGAFKRLKATEKELGVILTDPIFLSGISYFERATNINVVRLFPTEVPPNRKINQNRGHAKDIEQYALQLILDKLPAGRPGKAYGGPNIPEKVDPVSIDTNEVRLGYEVLADKARRMGKPIPNTPQQELDCTVAHELGHGVCGRHHGTWGPQRPDSIEENSIPPARIIEYNGAEATMRTYYFFGGVSNVGSQQSGNVNCIMAYSNSCTWVYKRIGLVDHYYEFPVYGVGTSLCSLPNGTGINANHKFFEDSPRGGCLQYIRLRD